MYQLVFKGECVAGVAPETARANVAQVFKANQAQIDRMFSGERVVIRNKLERDAAVKFQAALGKQGIVVHIEAMPGAPRSQSGPDAEAPATSQQNAAAKPQDTNPAKVSGAREPGPAVEPGERLAVAGERVDELLAGSSLTLGQPGETLGTPRRHEPFVFQEIANWSIAPPGERLVEAEEQPPVAVPDTSYLKVLPPGETG